MESKDNFFKKSWNRHPIIWNLSCIIISLVLIGFILVYFLDLWTHHGATARVPNVVGMALGPAEEKLDAADLGYVITDSVYRKDVPPGTVVDMIPAPGSVTKAGRDIYLTIVAFTPETVVIDMILTDISYKQAEAYLKARGLTVQKKYVTSLYPDLVVNVRANGRTIGVGSRVTANDIIVLEVGQAPEPSPEDDVDEFYARLEHQVDSVENLKKDDFIEQIFSELPDSVNKPSPEVIQLIKSRFSHNNDE